MKLRAVALLSAAWALALPLLTAAGLNRAYLLPSAEIKINRKALEGPLFCALTFDDGPDKRNTMRVAEVLEKEGVRATFFVVGRNVTAYPQQVLSLAAAGHEIANHSYSHADFTRLSEASQRKELKATADALASLGISTRWFRPPYGAINKRTLRTVREQGLTPLLWSVDPRDWAEPGASKIVSRVLAGTVNGAVILLHSNHAQTVEALPGIIKGLRERGYGFVTLTEWERAITGQGLPAPLAPLSVDRPGPRDDAPLLNPTDAAPADPGSLSARPAEAGLGASGPKDAGQAAASAIVPELGEPSSPTRSKEIQPSQPTTAPSEESQPAGHPSVALAAQPPPLATKGSAADRAFASIAFASLRPGGAALGSPLDDAPAPHLQLPPGMPLAVLANFDTPDDARDIWRGSPGHWARQD